MATTLQPPPPEADAMVKELLASAAIMNPSGDRRTTVMVAVQMLLYPMISDAVDRGEDFRDELMLVMQGVSGALGGMMAKLIPTDGVADGVAAQMVSQQFLKSATASRAALQAAAKRGEY